MKASAFGARKQNIRYRGRNFARPVEIRGGSVTGVTGHFQNGFMGGRQMSVTDV